jgi:hypothetical protein
MRARMASRLVPYRTIEAAGWKPAPGECHRNVDRIVAHCRQFSPVRGWLIFDMDTGSGGLVSVVRFAAHSVVQTDDEQLVDITPSPGAGRYPFIIHPGPPEEFRMLVEHWSLPYVDCPAVAQTSEFLRFGCRRNGFTGPLRNAYPNILVGEAYARG